MLIIQSLFTSFSNVHFLPQINTKPNQTKMQCMLNLRATHGVPLCLSGVTNPLVLSKEMEDHDRRRKTIKRQRSLAREIREGMHAIANHQKGHLDDVILYDLLHTHLDFTAKAA